MTPSFPHRMVAVVARIVLAIVEDVPAAVADVACLVAVPVSLWLLHRLIVRGAAWIGGHVRRDALDREYAELCASADAEDPGNAEHLPGAPRIRRPSPPPSHVIHRRQRRFPLRPMRRPTSNSDRRH